MSSLGLMLLFAVEGNVSEMQTQLPTPAVELLLQALPVLSLLSSLVSAALVKTKSAECCSALKYSARKEVNSHGEVRAPLPLLTQTSWHTAHSRQRQDFRQAAQQVVN
jgi:hypothetical protein